MKLRKFNSALKKTWGLTSKVLVIGSAFAVMASMPIHAFEVQTSKLEAKNHKGAVVDVSGMFSSMTSSLDEHKYTATYC